MISTSTICLALLLTLLYGGPVSGAEPAAPADKPEVLLDRIVAVVEEDAIMQSELEARMTQVMGQLQARGAPIPSKPRLQKQVLERLILEKLQLQRAKRMGIRIDDLQLNDALRQIARENNLDLTELRQRIVADGIDWREFREQIRTELTIRKLRERQVDQGINITDQEIDDLLANQAARIDPNVEYRLRHILITLPEAPSPEEIEQARQHTETLRAQIVTGGAEFAEIAIAESAGQHALEGGDLGFRRGNQLPTIFARRVPKMQIGAVSEPIRSPSGFHLIKLVERRGGQRNLVEQTHARHILIKTNAMVDDAQAKRQLETLRNRLQAGADFAELAKAHSDDTTSAADGGDLGWLNPGDTAPAFEQHMNTLDPGELSRPFESRFGWHLLEVLERRQQDSTRELRRSEARQILAKRKREQALELWLSRLRDEAYVDIRLDSATEAD